MTDTTISTGRTNREVARATLLTGLLVLAVAVVLTFANNWLADYGNSGDDAVRTVVLHLWSVAVQLSYPLGAFLTA